ncbi:MAG: hypothetical protein QOF73_2560 [Thermomicrobiales bacterium]|jgi:hypothetical protein|nr:hypothetical protein [Thermomicrobiales bacterium]
MAQPARRSNAAHRRIDPSGRRRWGDAARILVVLAIVLMAGAGTGPVLADQRAEIPATASPASHETVTASTATEITPAADPTVASLDVDTPIATDAPPMPTTTTLPEPAVPVLTDDTPDLADHSAAEATVAPTAPIESVVMLVASVSCPESIPYAGLLTMSVDGAAATILDIRAVRQRDEAAIPVELETALPATVEPGVVEWRWHLDGAVGGPPVAMFVRVAELHGAETANRSAGDDPTRWLKAEITWPTACPTPTATADATPRSPGATATGAPGPASTGSATPAAPTPTETPDASAGTPHAATASLEPVTVEARTTAAAATPGEWVDQWFRVRNTTDADVTVRVTATTSSPRWAAFVFEADGVTPVTGPIVIGAHASADVIVRILVPSDARVGDRNTTTLDARPADLTR